MTLQDLKNNKPQIIATIIAMKGEEAVKPVMAQMLRGIDCCETIEELISDAIYMEFEHEDRPEKSKIAALLGKIAEYEN